MSKTVGGQFSNLNSFINKKGGGSKIKVAVRIRPLLEQE